MVTNGVIVATNKAHNDWGSSKVLDKLSEYQSYIANNWKNDISNGNNKYSLSIGSNSGEDDIHLDNPSDTAEALEQSYTQIVNSTSLRDYFDVVIVLDSRTHSDAAGRAYLESAGTIKGVGYVANDGGKSTAGHELAHTYGGTHSTFESTELHHSIMGSFGRKDCNDNTSYTSQGHWYSGCTRDAIRTYIDNNLG